MNVRNIPILQNAPKENNEEINNSIKIDKRFPQNININNNKIKIKYYNYEIDIELIKGANDYYYKVKNKFFILVYLINNQPMRFKSTSINSNNLYFIQYEIKNKLSGDIITFINSHINNKIDFKTFFISNIFEYNLIFKIISNSDYNYITTICEYSRDNYTFFYNNKHSIITFSKNYLNNFNFNRSSLQEINKVKFTYNFLLDFYNTLDINNPIKIELKEIFNNLPYEIKGFPDFSEIISNEINDNLKSFKDNTIRTTLNENILVIVDYIESKYELLIYKSAHNKPFILFYNFNLSNTNYKYEIIKIKNGNSEKITLNTFDENCNSIKLTSNIVGSLNRNQREIINITLNRGVNLYEGLINHFKYYIFNHLFNDNYDFDTFYNILSYVYDNLNNFIPLPNKHIFVSEKCLINKIYTFIKNWFNSYYSSIITNNNNNNKYLALHIQRLQQNTSSTSQLTSQLTTQLGIRNLDKNIKLISRIYLISQRLYKYKIFDDDFSQLYSQNIKRFVLDPILNQLFLNKDILPLFIPYIPNIYNETISETILSSLLHNNNNQQNKFKQIINKHNLNQNQINHIFKNVLSQIINFYLTKNIRFKKNGVNTQLNNIFHIPNNLKFNENVIKPFYKILNNNNQIVLNNSIYNISNINDLKNNLINEDFLIKILYLYTFLTHVFLDKRENKSEKYFFIDILDYIFFLIHKYVILSKNNIVENNNKSKITFLSVFKYFYPNLYTFIYNNLYYDTNYNQIYIKNAKDNNFYKLFSVKNNNTNPFYKKVSNVGKSILKIFNKDIENIENIHNILNVSTNVVSNKSVSSVAENNNQSVSSVAENNNQSVSSVAKNILQPRLQETTTPEPINSDFTFYLKNLFNVSIINSNKKNNSNKLENSNIFNELEKVYLVNIERNININTNYNYTFLNTILNENVINNYFRNDKIDNSNEKVYKSFLLLKIIISLLNNLYSKNNNSTNTYKYDNVKNGNNDFVLNYTLKLINAYYTIINEVFRNLCRSTIWENCNKLFELLPILNTLFYVNVELYYETFNFPANSIEANIILEINEKRKDIYKLFKDYKTNYKNNFLNSAIPNYTLNNRKQTARILRNIQGALSQSFNNLNIAKNKNLLSNYQKLINNLEKNKKIRNIIRKRINDPQRNTSYNEYKHLYKNLYAYIDNYKINN